MADQTEVARQPLGMGMILGDSFSGFFSSFWKLMVIIILPTIVMFIAQIGLLGTMAFGIGANGLFGANGIAALAPVLVLLLLLLFTLLIWGAAILAVNAKISGQPLGVFACFGGALAKLPQMFFLGLAVLVAMVFVLSIIGGLPGQIGGQPGAIAGLVMGAAAYFYFAGALSPLLPVILIDNGGWGSLLRSLHLTRGYRWKVAGTLFVFILIVFLVFSLFALVAGFASSALMVSSISDPSSGTLTAAILGLQLLNALLAASINGLAVSFVVVLYRRLIELKEGVASADLAQVFE